MAWCIRLDVDVRFMRESTQKNMRGYTDWDRAVTTAAGGQGIFLHFGSLTGANEETYSTFYFRGTYAVYPLPVGVAHEGVVINTWRDIMNANFQPDDAWLKEHHLGSMLSIAFDESQFTYQLHRVGDMEPVEIKSSAN